MVVGTRWEQRQGLSRGCRSCLVGAVGMQLLVLTRMALKACGQRGINQTWRNTIPVWRSELVLVVAVMQEVPGAWPGGYHPSA